MNYAQTAGAAYLREDCLDFMTAQGCRRLPAVSKAVLYAKGNVLLVGFRGTLLTDTQDVADDAALVAGSEDLRERFMQAVAWTKSLAKAYPNCRLMLATAYRNSRGDRYCRCLRTCEL